MTLSSQKLEPPLKPGRFKIFSSADLSKEPTFIAVNIITKEFVGAIYFSPYKIFMPL